MFDVLNALGSVINPVAITLADGASGTDWSALAGYGADIVKDIKDIVPTAIGVAVPILGLRKAISFFTGLIRSA